MTKELFVSSTPHETKVGMVEDDQLAEVYLERENEYTLAGSIYKGKVTRVLPGMQSAFVDIGLERDAFLYVSDFMELTEHDDDVEEVVPTGGAVAHAVAPTLGEAQPVETHVEQNNQQEDQNGETAASARTEPSRNDNGGASASDSRTSTNDSRNRFRGGRNRRRRGGRR